MANKNDTAALLGALVITVGLLGAGGWWFVQQQNGSEIVQPGGGESPGRNTKVTIADRLSYGDKLLLQSDNQADKLQGIEAYGKKDYVQAQQFFQASLQATPNDPETLIYLNNAKASQAVNSMAIAVTISMPVDTDTGGVKEILRGVAQAQQEFNNGGQALKVLIGDDDGDVAIATDLAKEFSKKSEILGVIGHFSSDTSLAASQVYQEQGLVMISPTSTSVSLSSAGNYIFRTVPSDRFAGNALSNYLLNNIQVTNVAVFYNAASDYSNSLKDSLTTDLFSKGGNVVMEIDVNQGGFNGAKALADAQAEGAEAIALVTNTPTLDQALQIIQVNENKLPIVAGDSLYQRKTLEIGGRDSEGMVLAVSWHILSNPDATFPKTSHALWDGDVNWRTALSYDAAEALITAIQLTPNPNRETIQATLANPSFVADGAAQPIKFISSGDRNQPIQMVEVVKGDQSRSGLDYEFVPVQ